MMFLWIILIAIAIVAIWYFGIYPYKIPGAQSPSELIEHHYANGEISREEYEKRKAKLEKEKQVQ